MNTKLILIEGLPGFGKTTTAQLIHEILIEKKENVELFLEGNLDHPADYDGVAYFTPDEFDELLRANDQFKQMLQEKAYPKKAGYVLSYQKLMEEQNEKLPEALINAIYEKDIYELPFEKHIELVTDRWREFVTKAQTNDKVYIFECCFIQNPITIGMIKYNTPKSLIMDYVKQLAEIIQPLQPMLFYVQQEDLQKSFERAVKERPKQWSEGFINYYTTQGYGKAKLLSGLDGTIQVLQERLELEKEIVDSLDMRKAHVDNTQYNKEEHKSLLKAQLNKL